uniref:Uncharacterized protein n=1 Tax=Anguilla anguilla TaxID=7936 RepID=A0A0E9V8L4_ANGAN
MTLICECIYLYSSLIKFHPKTKAIFKKNVKKKLAAMSQQSQLSQTCVTKPKMFRLIHS